jgi:inosine-uridine nucleoside N-ribohydrolase
MPLPVLAQWDNKHVGRSVWNLLTLGFQDEERLPVWIDCDPGHDDAFALVLAAHHPRLHLLGVSTVDGNGSVENTTLNAARAVKAAGVGHIKVHAGAAVPLLRRVQPCLRPQSCVGAGLGNQESSHPEHIHGRSGMELLDSTKVWPDTSFGRDLLDMKPAVEAMASAIMAEYARLNPKVPIVRNQTVCSLRPELVTDSMFGVVDGDDSVKLSNIPARRVKIVTCGPLTNIALLVSLYREIVPLIDVIILGGALLSAGNVSPVAEFNIRHDPEAFHIVTSAGIENILLIPLEVTHTVLADEQVMEVLQRIHSPFGSLMVGLLTYYGERYREAFGFRAPPLHDPVAVAAVFGAALGKFSIEHHHVDVELHEGSLCYGKVVVDVWGHTGRPPNVYVALAVDTAWFWSEMLDAIKRANDASPL